MSSNSIPESGERQRLKLTISYDGGMFRGSQRQGTQRTVQAEVERALGDFWGEPAQAVFAGRTDTGVHAAGQVVSCEDVRPDLTEWQVRKAINARLPEDVSLLDVERVSGTFHARYDALWREYRYRIWAGVRTPLAGTQVLQRERRMTIETMVEAARELEGTHDFASFAGGGEGVPWSERRDLPRGSTRTVFRCRVEERAPWWCDGTQPGRLIEVQIVADGFLPRMVRGITGTLLEIGYGTRGRDWIPELLTAKDRRLAAKSAPAHGLTFWRVGYAGDLMPGAGPDPR